MVGADSTDVRARAGSRVSGLLERKRELAAIEDALLAARGGQGSLLYVEAHAGLGKSELLAAAAASAAEAGMRVLSARGSELELGHSFGVAMQLFEPPLARAGAAERDDLLAGAAALARPLFEGNAAAAASPEDQLFTLLHGLYWLSSNLAEQCPSALVVDDAHWADRSTLRFLVYVAQRLDDLPLAVLTSARPAEPGAPGDLLLKLKTHAVTQALNPTALSRAGVRALVEGRFSGAEAQFIDACSRVTDGNPYLVNELLADLVDRGVEPTAAAANEVGRLAPDSVLQAALARLARLPDEASSLARAVAVLGDEATVYRAAALERLAQNAAAAATDALRAAEFLSPGEPLAFVHPLLRSAIYAEIPEGERAQKHARAARLLDDGGAPAETVAAHLLAAAPAGDPWAVARLRRSAARCVTQGAADSAVSYLTRALEEPPPAELRPELLVELGRAESLVGHGDAIGRLDQALELIDDPRRRADILRELGWTLQKSGDMKGAVRAFERGLEALSALPGDDVATALEVANLRTAHLGASLLEPSSAGRAHQDVAALVEKDAYVLNADERGLLSVVALHRLFRGERHDEVIALSKEVWGAGTLLEQEGSDSQTIWHVIGCLSWADDLDGAEEIIELTLDEARREGSVVTLALGLYSRSWPRYWRGDLSGAAADAQAAVRAWSGEYSMYLPVAAYWLAISLLELDEVEAAAQAVDFADAERRWGDTNMYGPLLAAQAAVDMAGGDHQEAVRKGELCGESVLGTIVANPAVFPWRSYLSTARLAAGDRHGAREAAREELGLARHFGAARPLGISLRSAGVAEGGGAGVALLEEAVQVLRASPARLEFARSLVELGAAMRRGGSPAAARGPLREGLELAHRIGAVIVERRAREELLAAGAKPRRRELTGRDSLTPSERRVADMAVSGMTNREIAQTLFVTVKAVQWHLGNSYRKLGISSREDLARELR